MTTCQGCVPQQYSPNGDAAIDAAINIIGHELAEAATDPTGSGWCYSGSDTGCFVANAVENCDQCAWDFPNVTIISNYRYNLQVGSRKYLVQSNWNLTTKNCTMS